MCFSFVKYWLWITLFHYTSRHINFIRAFIYILHFLKKNVFFNCQENAYLFVTVEDKLVLHILPLHFQSMFQHYLLAVSVAHQHPDENKKFNFSINRNNSAHQTVILQLHAHWYIQVVSQKVDLLWFKTCFSSIKIRTDIYKQKFKVLVNTVKV